MHERLDTPYGEGSGRTLNLDIYAPDEANSERMAVLMFHGGGWRRGSRKSIAPRAKRLQAEGFTAITVEYRLLEEAPWPAPLHDAKAAIRWTRANAADLGIDPDRIALCGFSAGAHISLVTAGTAGMPECEGDGGNPGVDSSVAAVAAFYPPTSLTLGADRGPGTAPASRLLGDDPSAEAARAASPLTYVSPAYPPTFFLHGSADVTVSPDSSRIMHEALLDAGVMSDRHVFAGQFHEFDMTDVYGEAAAREVAFFFRRTVSQRDAIAARVLEQNFFARPPVAQAS